MKHIAKCALAATALIGAACSHHVAPENDPAALARVRADLRMVGGETTWVAHGVGYELVSRTRGDIAVLQPELERTSALLMLAFPHDTLARVVATVRRVSQSGQASKGAAPLPEATAGPVVELTLPDAKHRDEDRKRPQFFGGRAESELVRPVLRSWLATHAANVTGKPARFAELSGEVDDEQVPAWTYEMLLRVGDSAAVDDMTRALSAHPESVIPLATYFKMLRPAMPERLAEGRGREPSRGPGEEGGGGGGRGGMGGGGMGGGGMGGGRGGFGGGMGGRRGGRGRGGPPPGEARAMPPLEGLPLFAAQSAVFGRFLSREGFAVIGELTDAQIARQPIEPVLTAHGLGDLASLDRDWRFWLSERAASLERQ